jgi:hypothetical protein
MNTIPMRHPYQGVLQILQFNGRFYAVAAAGALAALLIAPFLPHALRIALLLAAAPALYWLAASLLVSHYVYDRYPLYNLGWIPRELAQTPRTGSTSTAASTRPAHCLKLHFPAHTARSSTSSIRAS